MKVTAIVPVYNFVGGLEGICRWLRDRLPALCDQHRALIWDDRSQPEAGEQIRETAERFGLASTRPAGEGEGSLKRSLEHAARGALEHGHDAVLVCEHDAVPDDVTFSHMLEVFRAPFRQPLASVSPMYQWQGRFVYPTHAHWHTDGLDDGGRRDYPGIGTVADVGAPGVPFLFSLWVPEVLSTVNRPQFPSVGTLDGTFGKHLHEQGYHHLRLLEAHIDHIGGGQCTWQPGWARPAAARRQAGPRPRKAGLDRGRQPAAPRPLPAPLGDWLDAGGNAELGDGGLVILERGAAGGGGSERGLASTRRHGDVELAFDLRLDDDVQFIAKVQQQDQLDQHSNSYHLACLPGRSYLARQGRVLADLQVPRQTWVAVKLRRRGDRLQVLLDGELAARVDDGALAGGYCFLGTRGGRVELRGIELTPADAALEEPPNAAAPDLRGALPHHLLRAAGNAAPRVSIVTTVYDRVDCLRACLRTVRRQTFADFEHLIVADHPPRETVAALLDLVAAEGDERTALVDLRSRHHNWGIAPASVGLRLARGSYVCFLSDDNGYTAGHLEHLVAALDRDPGLGFVYSSCVYGARGRLRAPEPRRSSIDLGQPLFRRELFHRHLGDRLPFDDFFWDWHMIERFLRAGVAWSHVDRPSFLFKLKDCPPAALEKA